MGLDTVFIICFYIIFLALLNSLLQTLLRELIWNNFLLQGKNLIVKSMNSILRLLTCLKEE